MEISPAGVMSMWAGGVAAGGALVMWWEIVGRGFTWLVSGVAALLALAAVATDPAVAWPAIGAMLLVAVVVRQARAAAMVTGVAAAGLVWIATADAPIAAVSGAVFLGAVTAEMALGHWYLVDPQLPRWALRRLAIGGVVAAAFDVGVLAAHGAFSWAPGDTAVGVGFVVLGLATITLLGTVLGALREEGYSGVMAATGLSYLALLTALGTAVVGRMLAAGPVLG